MTTSPMSLSQEQAESLVALGGWSHIAGDGWFGLKRPGVNGVVYLRTDTYRYDGHPDAGWNGGYEHEPDNGHNRNLLWRRNYQIDPLDLARLVQRLIKEDAI